MSKIKEIETQTEACEQNNTEVYDFLNTSRRENDVKINIISFDPDLNIDIQNWLVYFNNICEENNLNEAWKLHNISKYLKGNAITTYINECLSCKTFLEISVILQEKFLTITIPTFSEYTNLKLKDKADLMSYFHKKREVGKRLGLNEQLILEGLTDGLPINLKQLLTLSPPKSTTEWITCASKLVKVQETETYSKPKEKQYHEFVTPRYESKFRPSNLRYVPPENFRSQFRPSVRPEYHATTNYRLPFNNPRQQYNQYQKQFVQNTQKVHLQKELPPSPCRLCERQGITNAYHWVQTCPFSSYREPQKSDHVQPTVENTRPKQL